MNKEIMDQARTLYDTIRFLRRRVIKRHSELMKEQCQGDLCLELTLPQVTMMMVVREYGEMTIGELADALHVSAPSVSSMVDRLVEMGLLKREHSKVDRRTVNVSVSPESHEQIEHFEASLLQAIGEMLEKVGPECASQWCSVYERIRSSLGEDKNQRNGDKTK